jgi:hypothetical protein
MLTTGRYLAGTIRLSLSRALITCGLSVLAIAAVRTSMLLPVFASIVLMILLVKPPHGKRIVQRGILGVAAILVLTLGPLIASYLGGYEFDVAETIEAVTSASENLELTANLEGGWSENSIGRLLLPANLVQAVLFIPLRMVLYLVTPLHNMGPIGNLLAGNWIAWMVVEGLCFLSSSVINMLAVPCALAALAQSVKRRKDDVAPLVFHVSYWVTFVAIAGGNLVIHERYRVMATLLLWGCAWLGARTCSKGQIYRAAMFWYGLVSLGALFYFGYKGL